MKKGRKGGPGRGASGQRHGSVKAGCLQGCWPAMRRGPDWPLGGTQRAVSLLS